jgi:hypothetical protein
MKIAVQVSGNLRTFETCGPLLKRYLLDRYDCDVFVHTWDQLEHNQQSYHGGFTKKNGSLEVNDDIKKKVEQFYHPKKFVSENQSITGVVDGMFVEPRPVGHRNGPHNGTSCQTMWNGLWTQVAANKLRQDYQREKKVKYDFAVRIRPDVGLLEPFSIEPFLPFFALQKQTCVNFPACTYFLPAQAYGLKDYAMRGFVCLDVLYFSNPETMDSLMMILDHFDYFYRQVPKMFPADIAQRLFCGEDMWVLFQEYMGVAVRFGKINWVLKRMDSTQDVLAVHQDRIENSREHLTTKRR